MIEHITVEMSYLTTWQAPVAFGLAVWILGSIGLYRVMREDDDWSTAGYIVMAVFLGLFCAMFSGLVVSGMENQTQDDAQHAAIAAEFDDTTGVLHEDMLHFDAVRDGEAVTVWGERDGNTVHLTIINE